MKWSFTDRFGIVFHMSAVFCQHSIEYEYRMHGFDRLVTNSQMVIFQIER